jgi:hypothetical protein
MLAPLLSHLRKASPVATEEGIGSTRVLWPDYKKTRKRDRRLQEIRNRPTVPEATSFGPCVVTYYNQLVSPHVVIVVCWGRTFSMHSVLI